MTSRTKSGAVVVGVDGSPNSDAAVEWAVAHARMVHRPLVIAHGAGAVGPRSEIGWESHLDRARNGVGRRVTGHALRLVRRLAPGLEVEVVAPLGDADQVLLDLAQSASIVVLGTRGRGVLRSRLLGSVSIAVAERAACPVAVVRPARGELGHDDSVVVGVDAESTSYAALEFAFELAAAEGRPLRAVHTWGQPGSPVVPTSYDVGDHDENFLVATLRRYAEKYPDVRTERVLIRDEPGPLLVELSESASTVVVGTHGRTGFAGLRGSVSRYVLEHAHCTVVVVRDHR